MSYILLDVGGTNVRYAYADRITSKELNCKKKLFVKTGNPHTEVKENICSFIDRAPGNLEGIGVSLAAVMERETGKVKTWPNNSCWNNFELIRYLNDRYKVPIVIEDDANCGAIGEYHCISVPPKNMAYIPIGTGIGSGLIFNGSLFTGDNGYAGELGHTWIDEESNIICNCGNKGCFQSMVSGPAVLKEYNRIAKTAFISSEQVFEKYSQNDPNAVRCVSNMLNKMTMVIYNLAILLDISVFIIGGGIGNIRFNLTSSIESKVNRRLKPFEHEISIKKAQLGEFSGIYGALELIKKQIISKG